MPSAAHQPPRRESLNLSCAEFMRAISETAPAQHLYLASRLPSDGDDDLSRLLADLPGVAQLTVREAATCV